jgi:1-acyl-sn-glycerol-3-phosphate acyltransferase
MEAFKYGVAILALGQGVPIVPFHFKGTANVLPPRERHLRRAPVEAAVAYSEELLGKGWSLIIFPEGTRAKRGHMEAFKYGVAILALGQGVPIVPFHFKGTANVLPPRERHLRRAPVEATIGAPVSFAPGTALPEAVAQLQEAVRTLAGEPDEPTAERKSAAA